MSGKNDPQIKKTRESEQNYSKLLDSNYSHYFDDILDRFLHQLLANCFVIKV